MIRCETICCPVCGRKEDGCLVGNGAAICVRTVSEKRCGQAGYYHQIDFTLPKGARKKVKKRPAPINWNTLHQYYRAKVIDLPLYPALDCGWNGDAWTVPMYNSELQITGFQRAYPNGKKKFVFGSKPGVFMSKVTINHAQMTSIMPRVVMIPEGMGDTNTAYDVLGYTAIGRSSANQSIGITCTLLSKRSHKVIVVPDNDPPGLMGGKAMVKALLDHGHHVVLIVPPTGDLSDWVKDAGSQAVYEHIDKITRGVWG